MPIEWNKKATSYWIKISSNFHPILLSYYPSQINTDSADFVEDFSCKNTFKYSCHALKICSLWFVRLTTFLWWLEMIINSRFILTKMLCFGRVDIYKQFFKCKRTSVSIKSKQINNSCKICRCACIDLWNNKKFKPLFWSKFGKKNVLLFSSLLCHYIEANRGWVLAQFGSRIIGDIYVRAQT